MLFLTYLVEPAGYVVHSKYCGKREHKFRDDVVYIKTETKPLYFYLFYIISKGIFHIGGLVSKMHISVYVLFTEWKCLFFFFVFFFTFIVYNLGIMNIQCIL